MVVGLGVATGELYCSLDPNHPSCQAAKDLMSRCLDESNDSDDEPVEDCATEVAHCQLICSAAQYDPGLPHVWGGSFSVCMNGCVSARCGGNGGGGMF